MEYLSIGYVLKAHGLKGEIKVEPLTDYVNRFDEIDLVYLENNGNYMKTKIKSRRYSKGFAYILLEEYADIDKAETIKGKYLWITREMTRKLPKDTYLIVDIINSTVLTDKGDNLGKIINVIHTGSNDVYVIKNNQKEILIPALKRVFLNVVIENKKLLIKADELEGLI